MFRIILAGLIILTLCAGAAVAKVQTPPSQHQPRKVATANPTQKPTFDGTWVNDRGSAATFYVKDGQISGYYQTALGQPDQSQKFPLTGLTQGDQITFTVDFTGYGSMTSWTGQMSEDTSGKFIRTLWHLTRNVEDHNEENDLWSSIIAGASTFRPTAPIIPRTAPRKEDPS